MTEQQMKDRAQTLIDKGKLPVSGLEEIKPKVEAGQLKAQAVEVVKLPNWLADVEAPTPLQLMWCWFIGYVKQEAVAFDNGQKVDSPLSIFSWAESLVANWWKYLLAVVFVVLFFWLAFR